VDHLYSLVYGGDNHKSRLRRFNLAYWNFTRIARTAGFDEMLEAFESHLQLTVAEYAPRRVFVHSGVVGWKGRAILIPGLSYSGKSTLVKQLIRAGATYYSDEYAVLDERGLVHPYARPLGLRKRNSFVSRKTDPKALGAEVGTKPLRIGLVVSTSYKDGSRFRPKEITCGKGTLELLANTVAARSQPERSLATIPKALESARILKGVRGEARETAEFILRQIS
jgi:hypothetical protein